MASCPEPPFRPLLASELYAHSEGTSCAGELECHWCSAPCGRLWPHDDLPPIPFSRGTNNRFHAKRPGSFYICNGCFLFRRKRVTVRFWDKTFLDGKCPVNFSWWFSPATGPVAVRPGDGRHFYPTLLKPPLKFCLGLMDEPHQANHLQLMVANHLHVIRANSALAFTVNGVGFRYTVYELGEALRSKDLEGKEPGVRELVRLLGPPSEELHKELLKNTPPERKRGRFPTPGFDGKITQKEVTKK